MPQNSAAFLIFHHIIVANEMQPHFGNQGVPFFTEIRRIPITTENVRRGEIERNGIVCP